MAQEVLEDISHFRLDVNGTNVNFSVIFNNNYRSEGSGTGVAGMQNLELTQGIVNLKDWDQVLDRKLTFVLRSKQAGSMIEILYMFTDESTGEETNIAVLQATYNGTVVFNATGTSSFMEA
ncbi:hypothetical protein F52700_11583 [Fusarium sp. NRRL 52700]|nr:hypothetical protein F52700_11583 [Fusarium sp. NRRL 52700]